MNSSRIERAGKQSWLRRDCILEDRSPLVGERHILELISLGAPLSSILNTLCAAIDVQIGNVVSLALLSNEEHALHAIAHSAGEFGLHIFCSAAILSGNDDLLGTLEMHCCGPRSPTANDFQIIDRATHLAAVAIQHGGEDCVSFSRRWNGAIGRRSPSSVPFIK
jgi:hypothetical protein